MRTRIVLAAAAVLIAATGASSAQDGERRLPVSAGAPSLQGQQAWGFLIPSVTGSRDDEAPAATMSVRRPRTALRTDR